MRVAIPHNLGKDEARRRLKSRGPEAADLFPGGLADITTGWPSEDRMSITVKAMGQEIAGMVDIEESQVVFEVDLPPMLSFVEPIVEGTIKQHGQKLLGPPKD